VMKKSVEITVANPAGNITILVHTKCERSEYQQIATKLLAMGELGGEQVAFMHEGDGEKYDGRIEMCGLEFCGNASRTFGLMLAQEKSLKGDATIKVSVSGCDEVLDVDVNTETGHTKIKMPMYKSCQDIDLSFIGDGLGIAKLVDMDGIVHVVLQCVDASEEVFNQIKAYIMEKFNPPAMGVMFIDDAAENMVPVVYVKDVDTTYFEGSCGSGTTACGIAMAQKVIEKALIDGTALKDGKYSWNLKQPAGEIMATVETVDREIRAVYIEGPVEIGEVIQVKL